MNRDKSSAIDAVTELLDEKGVVLSNLVTTPNFDHAYHYFRKMQLADCAAFPKDRKLFGNLAGCKIIYINKMKAADIIAEELYQSILKEIGPGATNSLASHYAKEFVNAIYKVFSLDPEIIEEIFLRFKKIGFSPIRKGHTDRNNRLKGRKKKTSSNTIDIDLTDIAMMKKMAKLISSSCKAPESLYSDCKRFTNFFERLSRKYKFEPSKVGIDNITWEIRKDKN